MYSKDSNERKEQKASSIGEVLSVKGKFSKKDGNYERKKSKVLQNYYGGNAPTIRCYHCKKQGYTRNMCPERLNNHGGKDNDNTTIVQDDYESSNVLVVSSKDSSKE